MQNPLFTLKSMLFMDAVIIFFKKMRKFFDFYFERNILCPILSRESTRVEALSSFKNL